MKWFVALGIATAIFLLALLITNPLNIRVLENIHYMIRIPYHWFVAACYLLAVCGTPMVSSKLGFKLMGITALVAAIVTATISYYSFVSVWCFSAAVISGAIYLYAGSDASNNKLKPFNKVV